MTQLLRCYRISTVMRGASLNQLLLLGMRTRPILSYPSSWCCLFRRTRAMSSKTHSEKSSWTTLWENDTFDVDPSMKQYTPEVSAWWITDAWMLMSEFMTYSSPWNVSMHTSFISRNEVVCFSCMHDPRIFKIPLKVWPKGLTPLYILNSLEWRHVDRERSHNLVPDRSGSNLWLCLAHLHLGLIAGWKPKTM